jgi:hypothetical protein
MFINKETRKDGKNKTIRVINNFLINIGNLMILILSSESIMMTIRKNTTRKLEEQNNKNMLKIHSSIFLPLIFIENL